MPRAKRLSDGTVDSNTGDVLAPLVFHGVNFTGESGAQRIGDCPFCGREGKFSASIHTGKWDCKVCSSSGNPLTFLEQLWKLSDETTDDYSELAADRGLLFPDTLVYWGVAKSVITGEWVIPAYKADGKFHQLYRYTVNPEGRMVLMPTPGLYPDGQVHGMFSVRPHLFDYSKPNIKVCEGPWDGIIAWETLGYAKVGESGSLETTPDGESSLLSTTNVVAVPTCSVFSEKWASLFAGGNVSFWYDSDHPRTHPSSGRVMDPAGYAGARKAIGVCTSSDKAPRNILYLHWGDEGYDPTLKNGYDVRDALTTSDSREGRLPLLAGLISREQEAPQEWVQERKQGGATGVKDIRPLPCTEWPKLRAAWKVAFEWVYGLDVGLSVMLACVASTRMPGDQLWVKCIGPPSSGKTVLGEALSTNREYVYPKDTLTGLFSGFQTDRNATEDFSLASKLKDRTLVIKDGDTILQAPNKGQILSQFRALYDRSVRTSYGNKASRDYEGMNMGVVICGTQSLRELDSSELGERTLDVVIMDEIDDNIEDQIGIRAINRVVETCWVEANGDASTHRDPKVVHAMRLTGGYVGHLRANASDLLERVEFPLEAKKRCLDFGKFVSYMRCRPVVRRDEESSSREMSTRLRIQLAKLALCLAVVMNRGTVDREVLRRVRKVALDTARGKTFEMASRLYESGRIGMAHTTLSHVVNETDDKVVAYLRHLRKVGVAEWYNESRGRAGAGTRRRWRLTDGFSSLYSRVVQARS